MPLISEHQKTNSRSRAIWIAMLVPALSVLAVFAGRLLLEILPDGFPLCPMRRLTGLECPLCGGTHAVLALLDGRPIAALRHNPAVVAALLPCGWMYLRLLHSCFGRPYRPYRPEISRWMMAAAVVAVVVFTVIRNTAVYKSYFI